MRSLLVALSFLTAIPVRTSAPASEDLGRSSACFPLVGGVLGFLLALAQSACAEVLPPGITATLVVALWAALTGGLHLDGLADCADGLLATATRERRLEILRDSRVGAYGATALTLFLLLKVHALAALIAAGDALEPLGSWPAVLLHAPPLLAAAILARWVILIVAAQPSARPKGSGADFARGLSLPALCAAALLPLAVIGLGILEKDWTVLIAAIVSHVVAFGVIVIARLRIGGITGDVLGLTVELAELAVLLTFVAGRAATRVV